MGYYICTRKSIFFFARFTNGWSLVLASPWESEFSACYITFNWWRELLSLGSSYEEGFAHQEQIMIHWWDSDSLITIDFFSLICASMDYVWQHGRNLVNQFSLSEASSKYHLWRYCFWDLEWLEESFCPNQWTKGIQSSKRNCRITARWDEHYRFLYLVESLLGSIAKR